MSSQREVQAYIDAIQGGHVCQGQMTLTQPSSLVTIEPNCGVRDECPLFRDRLPQNGDRIFNPGMTADPNVGCMSFRLFHKWKRSEQWWIVQFEGRDAQEVQGKDALTAACAAWWSLLQSGDRIGKEYLIERRYTAREM